MGGFRYQAVNSRRRRDLTNFLCLALLLTAVNGCSRLHSTGRSAYVYVAVKQIYLRDHVALVASRVAQVTNGEKLRVLEQGKHFLKVQTPQGEIGWLELHAVIDQNEYNRFMALAQAHASQPAVATAVLYSEMYVHQEPNRKSQRFYLFAANSKVKLLERASVPRNPPMAGSGLSSTPPGSTQHGVIGRSPSSLKGHKQNFESQFLPTVPMEDWWLVRDAAGQTGWILSRDLQVDVPEDVAQYAENERMVGAYVLRTVSDPDSGKMHGQVPEYLTVLTPYKQGMPFDFDQVRVFTWDVRRHRYGTAFRQRDVAGFFPVTVTPGGDSQPTATPGPVFSFERAVDNAVSLDPATGVPRASNLEKITYRLEGNLVRRVLPQGEKAAPTQTATGAHPSHRTRRRRHVHR
ncbi:MAG TPA: SH3 domain-containing protein [Acidobacteriaceae bacterium]|nr:SH3 domain-containing protein [Acidobacteriaceae bacterium]